MGDELHGCAMRFSSWPDVRSLIVYSLFNAPFFTPFTHVILSRDAQTLCIACKRGAREDKVAQVPCVCLVLGTSNDKDAWGHPTQPIVPSPTKTGRQRAEPQVSPCGKQQ